MFELPSDEFSNSWVVEVEDGVYMETWSKHEAEQALRKGLVVRTAYEHLVLVNEGFPEFYERNFKEAGNEDW